MQFIALIYGTEGKEDVDMETLISQYHTYSQQVEEAGVLVGGDGLEPISTATSIRVRKGKTEIVDGPFAETKEQLGGYFIFKCKDLDEAIYWAKQIPSARYGTVEVRPVMEYDE